MNKQQAPYILWLPSWYPNKLEPYNGDFIQRHARAAALYDSITVISFTQYGESVRSDYNVETRANGNLKEIIVYVPFVPLKIRFIDRVRYNLKYYSFAKKFLKHYFRNSGFPSIVHVHVPVKAGNLAVWIKEKFKIPFIVSEQASTYLKEAPDSYYRRHWLYKNQVKKIFGEANHVTNVSGAIGEILSKLFNIKKLSVIHNTVDTTIFKNAASSSDVFTYIHVSSLTDQKNIFAILRSFRTFSDLRKDWKLIMVGPYTSDIVSFINENNLNSLIELTGEVPYYEVAGYMRKSHAFVLFSKHENFPCVVVEALCCGLPVISSDVAGIREAVDESNGILVKSEDEIALFNSIIKIKETYNHYDFQKISENAIKKYSFEVIGAQLQDLYREF